MNSARNAAPALVTALAAMLASTLDAQDDKQEKYARLRDEKTAQKVFQRADWTFDYDEARARAKEQNKLVFAYFTRSYAG